MIKTIYVAGPMSGHKNLNWPRFDSISDHLKLEGWNVINPAELDREAGVDSERRLDIYDYTACALRDVEALLKCDAIYLMEGWQHSKGACWERALAKHHNIRRFYEIPRPGDI
ncbi:MAG: hypothetical protein CMA63_06180 [Euryarchaeota archaeon]|jgi:hypothetical protein|nr:hypothetical protein [Euryarchaeota archaeon]|tara:strand:+ start:7139 stop:7477 length:339 start_codon:yes stop_codon:yes gene_type:complete